MKKPRKSIFFAVISAAIALLASPAAASDYDFVDSISYDSTIEGAPSTSCEAPTTGAHDPEPEAINVAVDTTIYLELYSECGIDTNSIFMTVNSEPVSPVVDFIPGGVALEYIPELEFNYQEEVWVTIDACTLDTQTFAPTTLGSPSTDLCMETEEYSFLTVPDGDIEPPSILIGGYGESEISSDEGGLLTIRALIQDDVAPFDVAGASLYYEGLPTGLNLEDDGLHGDFDAGDGVFGLQFEIPAGFPSSDYIFEIIAWDEAGNYSAMWPYLTIYEGSDPYGAPPVPGWEIEALNYTNEQSFGAPPGNPSRPKIHYAGFFDTEIYSQTGGDFLVLAMIVDPDGLQDIAEVQLYYGILPTGIFLHDDGEHGDFAAGDGTFGAQFNMAPGAPADEYLLNIIATDNAGHMSDIWPYLVIH